MKTKIQALRQDNKILEQRIANLLNDQVRLRAIINRRSEHYAELRGEVRKMISANDHNENLLLHFIAKAEGSMQAEPCVESTVI
jgi:hypothetical protein